MKTIFVVTLAALLAAFAFATPPECPNDDEEDVALFPNPDDCSTYYACIGDTAVLMHCSTGLEYNPDLRVCDWPKKNATCKRHNTKPPHPPHPPHNSTTAATTTTTVETATPITTADTVPV